MVLHSKETSPGTSTVWAVGLMTNAGGAKEVQKDSWVIMGLTKILQECGLTVNSQCSRGCY